MQKSDLTLAIELTTEANRQARQPLLNFLKVEKMQFLGIRHLVEMGEINQATKPIDYAYEEQNGGRCIIFDINNQAIISSETTTPNHEGIQECMAITYSDTAGHLASLKTVDSLHKPSLTICYEMPQECIRDLFHLTKSSVPIICDLIFTII